MSKWNVVSLEKYNSERAKYSEYIRKNIKDSEKRWNFQHSVYLIDDQGQDGFLGKEIPYGVVHKILGSHLQATLRNMIQDVLQEKVVGISYLSLSDTSITYVMGISFSTEKNSSNACTIIFNKNSLLPETGNITRVSGIVNISTEIWRFYSLSLRQFIYNLVKFCSSISFTDVDHLTIELQQVSADTSNRCSLVNYSVSEDRRKYYYGLLYRNKGTQFEMKKDRVDCIIVV